MPTTELHNKTQRLIEDIERKDRRFRIAQSIFTAMILIVLVGIVMAQYRTLRAVQQQLNQQRTIAQQADDNSKEAQATILRRLDCMTVFFSQRDRVNLTIANIDRCTLNRDGDIQKFFIEEPGEAPETTKTEQAKSETPPPLEVSTPRNSGESAKDKPTGSVKDSVRQLVEKAKSLVP